MGALGLLEVLSEVLMANGHLLQGILGPGPVVVELKEDGSPWLCQQVIRADLEDDIELKCILCDSQFHQPTCCEAGILSNYVTIHAVGLAISISI